jgi:hypothetical protein
VADALALALDALVAQVTPTSPAHVHLDALEGLGALDARTLVARVTTAYLAGLAAVARAERAVSVMVSIALPELVTRGEPPLAPPRWTDVAREALGDGIEPPALYFIDAAALRAHPRPASQRRVALPTPPALPPETVVECRLTPFDGVWLQTITIEPFGARVR